MFRRLFRLLVFIVLLALAAYAVSRLMNREEDFDDYDDIDSTLDFTETPVEIDIPYNTDAAAADNTPAATNADVSEGAAGLRPQQAPRETKGSVIDVDGIGPTYASRLREIGINSLEDLAAADPEMIAGKMEVIGGRDKVQDWIDQARAMTTGGAPTGSQAGE